MNVERGADEPDELSRREQNPLLPLLSTLRLPRETFDTLLPIIRQGGYIIADNTLWDGHVVDPAYAKDSQTHGIDTFNDYIARDTRVEKVILPIRDGLTIIRKK